MEEVLRVQWKTQRGGHQVRQLFVKWTGNAEPSWELLLHYGETEALDNFSIVQRRDTQGARTGPFSAP